MPNLKTKTKQPTPRQQLLLLKVKAARRGIPLEIFRQLTPADLRAADRAIREEEAAEDTRWNRRIARIVAAIYNNNPNKRKGILFTEEDMMPVPVKAVQEAEPEVKANDLLSKARWIQNFLAVSAQVAEQQAKEADHGS